MLMTGPSFKFYSQARREWLEYEPADTHELAQPTPIRPARSQAAMDRLIAGRRKGAQAAKRLRDDADRAKPQRPRKARQKSIR